MTAVSFVEYAHLIWEIKKKYDEHETGPIANQNVINVFIRISYKNVWSQSTSKIYFSYWRLTSVFEGNRVICTYELIIFYLVDPWRLATEPATEPPTEPTLNRELKE